MSFTVQLIVFSTFLASTFGAFVYNVSTGLEDYTLLVGRQMQNDIDIADLQLATVKARHADRMDAVTNQQLLVLQEVQQLDNELVQQQAFSLSRKHCVQKYKFRLVTLNEANKNFTKCLTTAENSGKTLTTDAESSLKNARNVREIEVPKIFPLCNKTYTTNTPSLEYCVTTKIDQQVAAFNQNMDLFQIRLEASLHKSSVIATEATRCSFVVEKNILTTNGAVSDLTDVCLAELKASGLSVGLPDTESKLMQRLLVGNKFMM